MRILVLGGTSFVGRAIVEDARRNGAEVTVFGQGPGPDRDGSVPGRASADRPVRTIGGRSPGQLPGSILMAVV